jgi:hypothetical protein
MFSKIARQLQQGDADPRTQGLRFERVEEGEHTGDHDEEITISD